MSITKQTLTINGHIYKYAAAFTVFSLLNYLGFKLDLVVVDYNGFLLPKEFWTSTKINPDDTLEILTIAGGGWFSRHKRFVKFFLVFS